MPSVIALRALLGAGLGLGALDLVWINAALAPQLVHREPAQGPVAQVTTITTIRPNAEPPDAPAPVEIGEPSSERDPTITKRLYFATGSAVLEVPARDALARMVAAARPSAVFALEGHADPRGTASFNLTLSKARAVAVHDELVRLGIDPARIRVDYLGAGRSTGLLWRDRRVEIQISGGTR